MEKARELGARNIVIRGDSELIIKQMRGEYRVKHPDMKELYDEAQSLVSDFDSVKIEHNLRHKNELADKLANLAMDRRADVTDADEAPIDAPGTRRGQGRRPIRVCAVRLRDRGEEAFESSPAPAPPVRMPVRKQDAGALVATMANNDHVKSIIASHYDRNDPLGWFETLYSDAKGATDRIPWADQKPNTHLVAWLNREKISGGGRSAIVVGCGLGDDAEELARRGFRVTGFDISSSAIGWAQQRFPESSVSTSRLICSSCPSGGRAPLILSSKRTPSRRYRARCATLPSPTSQASFVPAADSFS
jgi:hypothetical protein